MTSEGAATVPKQTLSLCPICGTRFAEGDDRVTVGDPLQVTDDTFELVRCSGCRSYVLNPRPPMAEMGAFYDSSFLTDTEAEPTGFLARVAAAQQRFNLVSELRWLDRHLSRGARYLDYSAGNGQIVGELSRRRPDVEAFATEFTPEYRRRIAARIGEPRVRASIDSFAPEETFDLISAFGVLEHVEDPRAVLRAMRDRLAPGGKIMLSIPNVQSLQRHATGRRWYSWLAPRHFNLMEMKTLRTVLREEGLSAVDDKHFFLRTSSSTFVLSLFPSLDPLLDTAPSKLVPYALLFYAFVPIELAAAALGRAGFLGIVARRS